MASDRRLLLRVSVRLALVWAVLSMVMVLAGRHLLAAALPFLEVAVNLLQADFSATLSVAEEKAGWVIEMQPLIVRPIPMTDQVQLRQFLLLQEYWTHVDHTLVPIVLLLSGVLAWPFQRWREFALRLLLAAPALLVVLALSAPVLLIGQVQMTLVRLATRAGAAFHEPWMVTFMIFMESGGRWLLPIAAAVACVAGARAWCAPAAPPPSRIPPVRSDAPTPPAFPPVSGG